MGHNAAVTETGPGDLAATRGVHVEILTRYLRPWGVDDAALNRQRPGPQVSRSGNPRAFERIDQQLVAAYWSVPTDPSIEIAYRNSMRQNTIFSIRYRQRPGVRVTESCTPGPGFSA